MKSSNRATLFMALASAMSRMADKGDVKGNQRLSLRDISYQPNRKRAKSSFKQNKRRGL